MTTQDFVKGIDMTGLTVVTGSEINQTVDAARVASDKGILIVTTDTALNVPAVPNPATLLEGVTPDFWTRYIWLRKPHATAVANTKVKAYRWNELRASDATLLRWEDFNLTAEEALALATAANTLATTANTNATAAVATSEIASDNAQVALDIASQTTNTIETINTRVTAIEGDIDVLENQQATAPLLTRIPVLVSEGGTSSPTVAGALNSFGLNKTPVAFVLIKDIKASGVAGGEFTAGAWQTRELNNIASIGNLGAGVTLAANKFTLPAGSYIIEAVAPAHMVNNHQAKLYNVTDNTGVFGSNARSNSSDDDEMTLSHIFAIVTIAAAKEFRIEHYCETTRAADGFGRINGFVGGSEIYTQVKITILAS